MLKSGEQKVEASGLNVSDFFSGETGSIKLVVRYSGDVFQEQHNR